MVVRATEIGDILKQQIAGFEQQMTVTNVGRSRSETASPASTASAGMSSELSSSRRMARSVLPSTSEEDSVGVIIMGEYTDIEEGDEVRQPAAFLQYRSATLSLAAS